MPTNSLNVQTEKEKQVDPRIAEIQQQQLGVLGGLEAPTPDQYKETALGELDRQAQESRQTLGRTFALSPGGVRAGTSQQEFESFEAERAGQAAQISLQADELAWQRQLGVLGALGGEETRIRQLNLAEAEQDLQAAIARAEQTGEFVDPVSGQNVATLRARLAQAELTGFYDDVKTMDRLRYDIDNANAELSRAIQEAEVTGYFRDTRTLQQIAGIFEEEAAIAEALMRETGDHTIQDRIDTFRSTLEKLLIDPNLQGVKTFQREMYDFQKSVQEAQLTGWYEKENERIATFERDLEQARLTGQWQGDVTWQRQLEEFQQSVERARLTGILREEGTEYDTLQKALQEAEVAFRHADYTGELDDAQTLQARIQDFNMALQEAELVGQYRQQAQLSAEDMGISIEGIVDTRTLSQAVEAYAPTLLGYGITNFGEALEALARGERVQTQSIPTMNLRQLQEASEQFDREMGLREFTDLEDRRIVEEQFKKTIGLQQRKVEVEEGLAGLQETIARAQATGRWEEEQTLEAMQFGLQKTLEYADRTGRLPTEVSAQEIGIDIAGMTRPDGQFDYDSFNKIRDRLTAAFIGYTGREPTIFELHGLASGREMSIQMDTLASKSISLEEGQQDLQARMAEAQATGFWTDPKTDMQIQTIDRWSTAMNHEMQRVEMMGFARDQNLSADILGIDVSQLQLATNMPLPVGDPTLNALQSSFRATTGREPTEQELRDIVAGESISIENQATLQARQLNQTAQQFYADLETRVTQWGEENQLNSTQIAGVLANETARIQLNHDQLEQQAMEFMQRTQLDLASLTGSVFGPGSVSAQDIGVDIRNYDFETSEGIASAKEDIRRAFITTGLQELNQLEMHQMLLGNTVQVESTPTLQAKQLASTITQQNLDRSLQASQIAQEFGFRHDELTELNRQYDMSFLNLSAEQAANLNVEQDRLGFAYDQLNENQRQFDDQIVMELKHAEEQRYQVEVQRRQGEEEIKLRRDQLASEMLVSEAQLDLEMERLLAQIESDADVVNTEHLRLVYQYDQLNETQRQFDDQMAMQLVQTELSQDQLSVQAEQAAAQMELDMEKFAAQLQLSEDQLSMSYDQFNTQMGLEVERFVTAAGMDAVNAAAAIERMKFEDARRSTVWNDLYELYANKRIKKDDFTAMIALINQTPYAPAPSQPSGWAMAASSLAGGIGQAIGYYAGSKIP